MGDDPFNALGGQFCVKRVAIIGLIANDTFGALGREPAAEARLDRGAFVRMGGGGLHGHRQSLGIHYEHDFHALTHLRDADAVPSTPGFAEGASRKSDERPFMARFSGLVAEPVAGV
jgi:hypothetical protein